MRILMVTATYYPSANGVAVSVENLKNYLKKAGHEVKVLAPDAKKVKKDPDVLRYPSVNNPFIKDYPIPIFPGLKSIYKIITTFKPDIVHAHHPFQVGFFANLLADNFKVPLVFTYHTRYDSYAEKYAKFLPKKFKIKFIEKSVDDFCYKTNLIISPSHFLKEILQKRYKKNKITVIPSALPQFTRTNISKNGARKKLNLFFGKKMLLNVSRLSREKNLEVLVSAMKYLPDNYFLCFVGVGPEEKNLKKLTERLKLQEKIVFAGKVPHSKIHLYYCSADIFVFSSKTETQGLVFLEAMHFGLPIIAVDSEATREWINDKIGKIVPNRPKAIAAAVMEIYKNWNYTNAEKLRKIAESYSPEKLTGNFIEAYEKLITK